MASSKEYCDFIIDQLSLLEDISYRKMMGEYILYYKGKIFGGIYDDRFLVKITDSSKRILKDCEEELPYESARPMILVDELENRELLKELITEMYSELPEKKVRKKK